MATLYDGESGDALDGEGGSHPSDVRKWNEDGLLGHWSNGSENRFSLYDKNRDAVLYFEHGGNLGVSIKLLESYFEEDLSGISLKRNNFWKYVENPSKTELDSRNISDLFGDTDGRLYLRVGSFSVAGAVFGNSVDAQKPDGIQSVSAFDSLQVDPHRLTDSDIVILVDETFAGGAEEIDETEVRADTTAESFDFENVEGDEDGQSDDSDGNDADRRSYEAHEPDEEFQREFGSGSAGESDQDDANASTDETTEQGDTTEPDTSEPYQSASHESSSDDTDDPEGDAESVPRVRVFNGNRGDAVFDSRAGSEARDIDFGPQDAKRDYDDGLRLFVDPERGEFRCWFNAGRRAREQFIGQVICPDTDPKSLLETAKDALEAELESRGISLVPGAQDIYDRLTDTEPVELPIRDSVLERMDTLAPATFVTDDPEAAVGLFEHIQSDQEEETSIAISKSGRTENLGDTDVVIQYDSMVSDLRPKNETKSRVDRLELDLLSERLTTELTEIENSVLSLEDDREEGNTLLQSVRVSNSLARENDRSGLVASLVPFASSQTRVDDETLPVVEHGGRYTHTLVRTSAVISGLLALVACVVAAWAIGYTDEVAQTLTTDVSITPMFSLGSAILRSDLILPGYALPVVGLVPVLLTVGVFCDVGQQLHDTRAAMKYVLTSRYAEAGDDADENVENVVSGIKDVNSILSDYEERLQPKGTALEPVKDTTSFLDSTVFADSDLDLTTNREDELPVKRSLLKGLSMGVLPVVVAAGIGVLATTYGYGMETATITVTVASVLWLLHYCLLVVAAYQSDFSLDSL